MKKPSKKTLVEVQPDHFRCLKVESAKIGQPMKHLTAVLLGYALGKMKLGQIHYVDPALAESPVPRPSSKALKKGRAVA